ncbi:hypothetical protein [Timonella sp. A28]|uniref:hypothetical protein n=1 Tax=Timonella sp. A28 TaxID=3442640 RepID=UPI003EBDF69C
MKEKDKKLKRMTQRFTTDAWLAAWATFFTGVVIFVSLTFADQDVDMWKQYSLWAWSKPLGSFLLFLPVVSATAAWVVSRHLDKHNEPWRHTLPHPQRHVYIHVLPLLLLIIILLFLVNLRVAFLVSSETHEYSVALAYSISTQCISVLIAITFGLMVATIWISRWSALAAFLASLVLFAGVFVEHSPFAVDGRGNVSAGYIPSWSFLVARALLLCGIVLVLYAVLRRNDLVLYRRKLVFQVIPMLIGIACVAASFSLVSGKYDQVADVNAESNVCKKNDSGFEVCVLPENKWLLEKYFQQYEDNFTAFTKFGIDTPKLYSQLTPHQSVSYQSGQAVHSAGVLYFEVLPKEAESIAVDPYFPLCSAESTAEDFESEKPALEYFGLEVIASWLLINHMEISGEARSSVEANSNEDIIRYLTSVGDEKSAAVVENLINSGSVCNMQSYEIEYDKFNNWIKEDSER